MSNRKRTFLTAEWRKLIMANYVVDPGILMKYLPAKTELDVWDNKCYVSLVGFMFEKVRVRGMAVPFHTYFPEVNLRFYVRSKIGSEWKRGVVFISEIVPKRAIAWVANNIYKENYSVCAMEHGCVEGDDLEVSYRWKRGKWNLLQVKANPLPQTMKPGSEEEFITEHFWGYALKNELQTVEYHVEHPRWDIYNINSYTVNCDFRMLYGNEFGFLDKQVPRSVFMAEGSGVKVFDRRIL